MKKIVNEIKKFHLKQIIIFMLILICSYGVMSFSKYIIEEYHGYFLNSKDFYFTSNRLKEDNPLYQVNNWSGVGSFDISFDLLLEKNSYIYSDYDIPYRVWIDVPTGVTYSIDKATGTIYKQSQTKSDTVTISVNPGRTYNENEHLNLKVHAESTSPYVKEITADYEYIVGKQGVTFQIDDVANQPYLMLKITNAVSFCKVMATFGTYNVNQLLDSSVYIMLDDTNKAKCVSQQIVLNYDTSLIRLDTTSAILDNATYDVEHLTGSNFINHLEFNIGPLSTLGIKFYKVNPAQNYTYPNANNTPSIINMTASSPT